MQSYTFWMGFKSKEGRLPLFFLDNLPLSIEPVHGQIPANLSYKIVCPEDDFFFPGSGIETPFIMKVTIVISQNNKPACMFLNLWNTVIEDVPLHIVEDLAHNKQIGVRFQADVGKNPTPVINPYQLRDYFKKPLKKLEKFINSTKDEVSKHESEGNQELTMFYFKKQAIAENFRDCLTILINNLNNDIPLSDWLKISRSFNETFDILNER